MGDGQPGQVSRPRPSAVDVLLLAVAAVWGSSYLAAKFLVIGTGVVPVLALRYLVAAAALGVVCCLHRPSRPTRRELAVGVLLGLTQASVLALETFGVARTTATNAGLLISLTIVATPVLEGVALRRWLPRRFFVAAALAVTGVCLLVTDGGFRAPTVGDLLVLGAALVRAGHVTALGRLTAGRSYGTLHLTLVQLVVGAVLFTALDVRGVGSAASALTPGGWLAVAFLGLFCSVFAFLVQLWAVRRTSAARASLLMGTEPLWAVAVGLTLGGEALGMLSALGAALVVAGTGWGQRIETQHRLTGGGVGPGADRRPAGGGAPATGPDLAGASMSGSG
jgi:drug/metabolite transporter (DMT)-like permease